MHVKVIKCHLVCSSLKVLVPFPNTKKPAGWPKMGGGIQKGEAVRLHDMRV